MKLTSLLGLTVVGAISINMISDSEIDSSPIHVYQEQYKLYTPIPPVSHLVQLDAEFSIKVEEEFMAGFVGGFF
jgi:hypothetical protein